MKKLGLCLTLLLVAAQAEASGLTSDQRDILIHTIYQSCYDKAHLDARYQAISEQTKVDVAKNYCACMATRMSQQVSDQDMTFIAQNKQIDPALQQTLLDNSQQCSATATTSNQSY